MKSNNGKRLVAAVAIFAMLVCALAIALPASNAAEETPVVDFNGEIDAYVGEGNPSAADVAGLYANNAGLGNIIDVQYGEIADNKATITVTGTLNKQNIAYNASAADGESPWSGDNQTDSAKVFYSWNWDYNNSENTEVYGEYWALVFNTPNGAEIKIGDGDASTLNGTGVILYLKDETLETTRTITYEGVEYTLNLSGLKTNGLAIE